MPVPKNAAKKIPAANKKANGNMEAKLARRKSQEFKDKIKGWNEGGAGIVQPGDQPSVADVDKQPLNADEIEAAEGAPIAAEPEADAQAGAEEAVVFDDDEPAENNAAVEEAGQDTLTPVKTKISGTSSKKQITPQPKISREIDLDKKAWVRRKSRVQADEVDAELKHGVGAPKKRVISDGHWRRDRVAKKESAPEEDEPKPPKPMVIRRSVANVGLKVPVSVQEFVEDQATRARALRSPSPLEDHDDDEWERKAVPDYESSGLKVYVKRRKRTKTMSGESRSVLTASETSFTAPSSTDKPSSSTDLTTPDVGPSGKKIAARPLSAPSHSFQGRPRSATTIDRSVPGKAPDSHGDEEEEEHRPSARRKTRATPAETQAARNNGQSSKSRVRAAIEKLETAASSSPVPPPAPKVYANRIEAWLGNMADPVTEADTKSLRPEPLSVSRKTTKKADNSSGNGFNSEADIEKPDPTMRRKTRQTGISDNGGAGNASDTSATETPTITHRASKDSNGSPIMHQAIRSDQERLPLRKSSSRRQGQRRKPSKTQRLPTVRSSETFDIAESVLSRNSDGDEPSGNGLKRRLTKHSDLISVLSLPKDDGVAIKPARSVRTHRTSLKRATIPTLMNEVTTDELKYQRELRTLVDGVIPVLLQSVLSRSESAQAAGLLGRLSEGDPSVTQPIVNMGVALERLRSIHRRIPMHEPQDLLDWGSKAVKPYEEYLSAWRLGFEDVIINLAPAEETTTGARMPSWTTNAPKNEKGDLVNGDGERVDVAYLLKRPLVRLKYLAKAFKGISQQSPSPLADSMATKYAALVATARQRSNDERARLEDEMAANIDPTRSRDPRSLAPILGVSIDPTRRVRARDFFDMDLQHSSGQQLVCRIELFMRDDAPERGDGSDVLFCEVSAQGRWLLFPPTPWHLISARTGQKEGELIVMIRGYLATGKEWHEIMNLQAADEQSAIEWVQMLGLDPAPAHSLERKASFSTVTTTVEENDYMMAGGLNGLPTESTSSRPPSPSEVEVPIGVRYASATRKWDASEVNSVISDSTSASGLRRMKARRYRQDPPSPLASEIHSSIMWSDYPREQPRYKPSRYRTQEKPTALHARSKSDFTGSSYTSETITESTVSGSATPTKKEYQVWMPNSSRHASSESDDDDDNTHEGYSTPSRPQMHQRTSSVPSMDIPMIPKQRPQSQEPQTPVQRKSTQQQMNASSDRAMSGPESAPAKLQKRKPVPPKESGTKLQKRQPSSEKKPKTSSNVLGNFPSLTPAFLRRNRRSSSPLKHEYEPSSASELSSESELSFTDDDESITSESTTESHEDYQSHRDDQISTIGDLKAFHEFHLMKPMRQYQQRQQQQQQQREESENTAQEFIQRAPPSSVWSASGPSLQPSDSASQGPYRKVPQTQAPASRTVASLFAWAESGSWASLHPEDCNIVVTPGLIEAFDLVEASTCKPPPGAPADVSPSACGVKPLVALELTPLVPLRRGTALDISIRSPCTENSVIRAGNNIMFRSRSPEECEALYNLINRARINNPTYIALQNARPQPRSNWAEAMDRGSNEHVNNSGGSWWSVGSRKNSTYRSSGSRPTSMTSQSSVGTVNSAFSALRRFSSGSRFFNIARSTVTSMNGSSRSTASESLESGASTPQLPFDPSLGTPIGLSNIKIRLYIRETASKWRDLGSARMTIMVPPRPDPSIPSSARTTGVEKRILILGKTRGETLLDATLGESSFERVARTGIAVSIWEDDGTVGARGGVLSAKAKVYMVQMKSERDAAYTFSQVGKLRY